MVTRHSAVENRINDDEILDLTCLIERLKRLRALNKDPDQMGITRYTWRSYAIDRIERR